MDVRRIEGESNGVLIELQCTRGIHTFSSDQTPRSTRDKQDRHETYKLPVV